MVFYVVLEWSLLAFDWPSIVVERTLSGLG